ncbi:MAG: class I adenylate-forming enzyme family protein [Pseudomonadota bacterium]
MTAPLARTFPDLLREQASLRGDAAAVMTATTELSFAELAARAAEVARVLYRRGVRRGAHVGLLANNRIDWLAVCFGVSALGATVVPFSTWSTARELTFLLADSGVRTVLTIGQLGEQDFAASIAAASTAAQVDVIVLDEAPGQDWPRLRELIDTKADAAPAPYDAPGIGPSATDTAFLLYTSGSSAHPKAVPLTHAHAIENGFNIGERQGLAPGDRVLVPVPLFWSYGAVNALPAIMSHGATLVLQPQFNPSDALDLIEHRRCTGIYTLPAITGALLAAPAFKPERTRTLRTGVTIGAPQDVIRAAEVLGIHGICNIYGSTETYGNCAVTPYTWPLEKRAHTQGPPLPGVSLRTVDPETGAPCATGEVGALEVTGYLTPGYVGASSGLNAKVFSEDGYFRTGDLASLDADGQVRFAGRFGEMIKRSGINVSPAEVEEVLLQLADVALAGVVGTDDARLGQRIVAFVVLHPDATGTPEDAIERCRMHCRKALSRYKWPDEIREADALPLTPTGKLMRKALPTLLSAGARHADP